MAVNAPADRPAAPDTAQRGGRWGYGLILAQSVIYGLGDPIAKLVYRVEPVYPVMVIRYLIALAILFALFGKRIAAGLRACRAGDWIVPSLCMGGAFVMGNLAVERTAATNAAFLRSLSSVLTPVLALAVFRRRYGRRHIPVLAAVLLGLYLLCGRGGLSHFGLGEVFALTQAFLLAGSLVFGQRSLDRVDPITLTAMMTAASALLAAVCMLTVGGGQRFTGAGPGVWAGILYLAVGCTITGYFLQNTALRTVPSRRVALLQCTAPVMTAVFSRLILGETPSAAGIAGAALILLSVAAEIMMKDEDNGR